MRRVLLVGVAVLMQCAVSAALANNCAEPMPFTEIPNGAHATREQMLAAQRSMKSYDNAVKTYTDCLHDAGDTSNKADQAVDTLQKLAARFNQELQAFKQHNGAS
jgi:hypothetical protein